MRIHAGRESLVSDAQGLMVHIGERECLNFVSLDYLGFGLVEGGDQPGEAPPGSGLVMTGPARSRVASTALLELEEELAIGAGAEAALCAPSVLHLMQALMETFAGEGAAVLVGREASPQLRAAGERARGRGAVVGDFRTGDPGSLRRALSRIPGSRSAWVLCDSIRYPGWASPLPAIAQRCREAGASLLIEDTLALGLHGSHGRGRNGSGERGQVVQVAGLDRAFGVPLAFAAGPAAILAALRRCAGALWSPTSIPAATLRSARRALAMDVRIGEAKRREVFENARFCREIIGLETMGRFPALSWYLPRRADAARAWEALVSKGIWAQLDPVPWEKPRGGAAIRLNLSAAHSGPPLARAWDAVETVKWEMRHAGD